MPWPLSQDYNEAVQNPATSFSDPELKQGEVVTNALGLPMPCSGNFADVYAVSSGPKKWAVKCFTRQIPGLRERYVEISAYLQKAQLPFTVEFKFIEQGIRVRGQWYPILKMQWVEGFALNEFVKNHLDKPNILQKLCEIWVRLASGLRDAKLAHCDLQHGNVLLVPGDRSGKLGVKLVDYDGMWVPALELLKSIELGHSNYQHPERQRDGVWSVYIDRFSHLVIYTALRALIAGGKPLWDKYNNGDNLLFKQTDLQTPAKSPLFQELLELNDPELRKLVDALMQCAAKPLEQTPPLSDLVKADATRVFGTSTTVEVARKAEKKSPEAVFARDFSSASPRKPRSKKSGKGLAAAFVLLLLAAGGGAGYVLMNDGELPWATKSTEIAQQPSTEVTATEKAPLATPKVAPPMSDLKKASDPKPMPEPTKVPDPPKPMPEPAKNPDLPRPEPPKPPSRVVPDKVAQDKAEKNIRERFKADFEGTKPEEKLALSAKLRAAAKETKDDPAAAYVLLRLARDLAAEAGDVNSALRVIEELELAFDVKALDLKVELAEKMSQQPTPAMALPVLLEIARSLAESAVEQDQYEAALRLLQVAHSVAGRLKSPLTETLKKRLDEVIVIQKEFGPAQAAHERLLAMPNDAQAQFDWGRFLCVFKGDWAEGLPHLARGTSGKWKDLAVREQDVPAVPAAWLPLADGWWDLADVEPNPVAARQLFLRSRYWYEKLQGQLPAPEQARVVQRLKLVRAKLGEEPKTTETVAPPDRKEVVQATYNRHMQAAEKLVQAKKFYDAILEYNSALALIPNDPAATKARNQARYEMRMALGNAYMGQRRYQEATREFGRALEVLPGDKAAQDARQRAIQEATKK